MKNKWRQSLSIFLLFFATPLTAKQLSLAEITQIAIHSNRDLQAARYTIRIAQGRLIQAGLWPNPNLNLNDTDDRFFTNEGEYSRSAGFSQALPISGRLAKQKNIAYNDVLKAFAEVEEAKRLLASKLANAYFSAVISERRLQQLNYLIRFNKELIDVINNRYHAAEVSELDKNTVKIEYQRILQEKAILLSNLSSQKIKINQLMGRQAFSPLALNTRVAMSKHLPPVAKLVSFALKNRPDRQLLLILIKRGQADKQLALAERFADWTVSLGVQQDKIAVDGAPPQNPDRALNLNLTVPLPLWNQNQGRIQASSATLTQALLALRALNLTIETEVANNYQQLSILKNNLQESQNTLLKLSQSNLKLARDAYSAGQISFLNVLQVQRQQNDTQMTFLTSLEKYFQVYVALCTEIGPGESAGLCPYLATIGNKICV